MTISHHLCHIYTYLCLFLAERTFLSFCSGRSTHLMEWMLSLSTNTTLAYTRKSHTTFKGITDNSIHLWCTNECTELHIIKSEATRKLSVLLPFLYAADEVLRGWNVLKSVINGYCYICNYSHDQFTYIEECSNEPLWHNTNHSTTLIKHTCTYVCKWLHILRQNGWMYWSHWRPKNVCLLCSGMRSLPQNRWCHM